MSELHSLLIEAAVEIRSLQHANELLAAKLEGVEMMAMAISSERPRGPGTPMKECVAGKIDRYLRMQRETDGTEID